MRRNGERAAPTHRTTCNAKRFILRSPVNPGTARRLSGPILVTPRRCAEAITWATYLYVTSLLGRRWISGCTGAAPRRSRTSHPAWAKLDRLAVPQHRAVEVHVEGDDHRRLWRRRRIAHRHVELHRVRLDRDRDDQHDQEHQHHVDERRGVDVDHHFRIGRAPASNIHCHCCVSFSLPRGRHSAAVRTGGSVMKPIFRIDARWSVATTRPTDS